MSHTSQYIGQAQDQYEELRRARARIAELEREVTDANKWAKQYHDDWVAMRDELERVKAEIRRRETGGTSSVAEINAIHELKRVKAERDAANGRAQRYLEMKQEFEKAYAQAEAALGATINQRNEAERFVNENYDLIGYWRDLFKRANAEKRKARTDARVLRAYGVE